MGVNAKLSDVQSATSLAGGELIYVVQGGNSRQATLTANGAGIVSDTGVIGTTGLALLAAAVPETARNKLAVFDTVADLLADTALAYTNGDPTVATGDIVEAGGYRYEVAASGASDENVTTAGSVKLYVLPSDDGTISAAAFGAVGDGVADDTAVFAAIATYLGSTSTTLSLEGTETYLIDTFDLPDDCILKANRATLKRRVNNSSPVLAVGERSVVYDAIVHGSLDTLGITGATNSMSGIVLDNYAKAINCKSSYNYRHGIAGKAATTTYTGLQVISCEARNNGNNPQADGSGTGDGINMTNVSDYVIRDCGSFDSARSDMVVTTFAFNDTGGGTDPSLTTGGLIDNLKAEGAGYLQNEINFEGATGVKLVNSQLPDSSIIFNGSDHVWIESVECLSVNSDGDYPVVINLKVVNNDKTNNHLALSGASPYVRKVRTLSTATKSGNTVSVVASDQKGHVHDVYVDGAFNAIVIDVDNFSGLDGQNVSNVEARIGPSGGTYSATFAGAFRRNQGKTIGYLGSAPSTGTWARSDMVYNTTAGASVPVAFVCVSAGNPGTWVPVGGRQVSSAYTVTNATTDRSFDADTVAVAELADIVGTLIADLKANGNLS